VKSLAVRGLAKETVAEHGGGNCHRKTLMNIFKNRRACDHFLKSERLLSLWKELINQRPHNLINEMIAYETVLRCEQVYSVKPGIVLSNREHDLPRLNSLPNVLAPTLNALETVGIMTELPFKSGLNFGRLHAFVVEKMDDDSVVILEKFRT
jgi:hypothetical protein